MTNEQALRMAELELVRWDLSTVQIEISAKMRATLGQAHFFNNGKPRLLKLSEYHVRDSSDFEVLDTIRHEIAHFLAGWETGHDHVWKRFCRLVGARPVRCATFSASTRWQWVIYCNTCQMMIAGFHGKPRRNLRTLFCKQCREKTPNHLQLMTAAELEEINPSGQLSFIERIGFPTSPRRVPAPRDATGQLRLF